MELEEAIVRFERSMRASDRSPRTVRWYLDILRRFQARGGGLSVEALEEYLADRKPEVSHATFAGEHRAFRRFCSWLEKRGYLDRNPMLAIDRPRHADPPPPKVATKPIINRLLVAANDSRWPLRDRALVLVLADTGARLSEFLAITEDNLQIIHRPEADFGRAVIVGKNNKRRPLLIGPAAMSELAAWLVERPPDAGRVIWVSEQGGSLTCVGVQQLLRRLSQRAGLPQAINPHAFRYGAAVEFLELGGDIRRLQLMLGHSDIKMTEHYLQLTDLSVSDEHARVSEQRFAYVPRSDRHTG